MVKFLYLSAGQALYICLPLVIGVAGLQERRRIDPWFWSRKTAWVF
jgi:hypothetical protein